MTNSNNWICFSNGFSTTTSSTATTMGVISRVLFLNKDLMICTDNRVVTFLFEV